MGQYSYYADKLSADRLRRCYEIAPPRVVRYLEAELWHVLGKIGPADTVLDLGCGYGRVLGDLAARAGLVVGIDNAWASLRAARKDLGGQSNCRLLQMNGVALGLGAGSSTWWCASRTASPPFTSAGRIWSPRASG